MKGALAAISTSLVLATASARASDCAEPEPGAVEAAKGLHRAAEVYFAEERFAEAIDAWRLAYELDCKAHRLLVNIGKAEDEAGHVEEAIEAYETYLERDDDPEIAPGVRVELAALRKAPRVAPAPPEPPVLADEARIGPYVAAGVGGALAVAGVAMLGVGLARADEGLLLQEVGGGFVALGVSTAAGALLWNLLDEEETIRPAVGLGGASLEVRF